MKHLLLVLIAVCGVSAQEAGVDYLSFDGRIVYELNSIKSENLKNVSRFVSDAAPAVYLALPTSMYLIGTLGTAFDGQTANRRYAAETGIQALTSLGISGGITYLTKAVVGRPRPYQAYPGLIVGGENPTDMSFPSGHSTGAAALATTFILRYPDKWYVVAPSVGYALWMGFSRMNLGVHYLTDVIAGYAIGAGVSYGVHVLSKELFKLAEPLLPADGSVAVGMAGTPSTPIFMISMNF